MTGPGHRSVACLASVPAARTQLANGPAPLLAGYAFENERTQHVIDVDVNNNVHELYRSGNPWNSGVVSGSIGVSDESGARDPGLGVRGRKSHGSRVSRS